MIPIYRPYFTGKERQYVNQCFDSTWISSKGEFIKRFEDYFAASVGVKYATSVCNGTVALHLALLSVGIGPGDEVIVPTLTYVASVNMIAQTGAKPVFVDSLADTWQMDPAAVERSITPRTKAVMMVHLYGGACDLKAIAAICKAKGLLLIADCAEAFGTYYDGVPVGSMADVATYSFFGNKTITTGEGGMVVTNDVDVFNRAYHLKTQAVSPDREYWHDMLGYNYRMTNICAAIGLAQLEHADDILAKKRAVAGWYDRYLAGLPVTRQAATPGAQHSWWLYSIAVTPAHRDALRHYLRDKSIETRPVFPPVHAFPHYGCNLDLPVAQAISASGINLPSFPDLTKSDVQLIASEMARFFDQRQCSEDPDTTSENALLPRKISGLAGKVR